MHLYVMARGNRDHLNRWENDLLARYFSYEHEKGKPKAILQLNVRPIQIYEITFPAEHLNEVLQCVKPGGYEHYKFYEKLKDFFVKLFGLKPIPEWKPDGKFRTPTVAVGVHGIGIKEDLFIDGIEQI